MPPACRAVLREVEQRDWQPPQALTLLETFFQGAVDRAVRSWAGDTLQQERPSPLSAFRARPGAAAPGPSTGRKWWQALGVEGEIITQSPGDRRAWTSLYRDWQRWRYQAATHQATAFRICFRLDPPEAIAGGDALGARWVLRYFLQDLADPSLLVPARSVWQERGNTLSYLNRHFDNPQEELREALEAAARLCPAVRRSLSLGVPEATYLSDHEAFTFLRETARLLEGTGFGVLVPPWWNKPDTRLRVRAKLHGPDHDRGLGGLGMDALVSYDWELALGDEVLSREEFERLAALKTPLVQVRGRWVMLQPDQIEAAIAFWQRQQERVQLPLREALSLALGAESELEGLPVSELQVDEQFASLLDALEGLESGTAAEAPVGFRGELRPYQLRGHAWMADLTRWGFGVCLADDMGLGKTIQAIALLLQDRRNGGGSPSLVVCPTSLVGNWAREVVRFAPELRVHVHHGNRRAEGDAFVRESLAVDLVISTYGLVRRDLKDLRRVRWRHIIIDEAQNIKNPSTKQSQAVRRLRGDYRSALTGTPIENRLTELWSIMAFLNPGYLGSPESFRHQFALPIERYQDEEASERLRKLVRPFLLRRVKTDPNVIADLPEKFEYKVFCNLTREQATLYEAVVRDAMETLHSPDTDDRGMQRRGVVLAMLTRLKQVCNHPALYLGDGSELAGRSGKLNRLGEMLEEVLAVGDRALVFTQFAQMGHLLQRHLQDVFSEEVLFLHGGTLQKQRDRLLERFQEDPRAPRVFVLSLKAGGTGLNLMRANHVFHFDRWWNPAVENQATDRAYRIGQTRDVQVHKYICLGTLEERIDDLIESKRSLAENIIGQGESWLTEMSTAELEDLIALRADAISE
jgi:superfamily II DNA or RNA helicase